MSFFDMFGPLFDPSANAPYMIPYTLQALANYLDKPLAEIARATRETTRKVYGI